MIINAMASPQLKKAVTDSARRRGIWPLDRSVVFKMVAAEKPDHTVHSEPAVKLAVELARGTLITLNNLVGQQMENKAKEKKKKGLAGKFDVAWAQELTDEGKLAAINLLAIARDTKNLKVDALHAKLREFGWKDEQLHRENG